MIVGGASYRIKAVRTREASIPFRRPLATRIGTFRHAPLLLVDLETEGGLVAHVPVFGFVQSGPALIGAVLRRMAEPLIGAEIAPETVAAISDGLVKDFALLGRQGLVRFAQSILDIALHDAMARCAGVPLYALLGGRSAPIRAYNSNGLGLSDPSTLGDEARALVAEGEYTHIKCRGGRPAASDDLAAISKIRGAVGDGIALSIDYNQGLDPAEARSRLAAVDDLGLAWIEEPTMSDDHATTAALTRDLRTPIQMGENYYGPDGAEAARQAVAFDLLMPDVLRIGGVTGWMRVAAMAERHAIPLSSHMSPEISVHLLAATPTADWLEFVDWGAEAIRDPLRVRGGHVTPSERPGTGIEWNEDVIARHRLAAHEARPA